MKTVVRSIVISGFFVFWSDSISSYVTNNEIDGELKEILLKEEFDWGGNYENVIDFIKSHEGFNNGRIYIDAAGIPTIGYGHVILPADTFRYQITEKQADSLLRADFEIAVKAIERNTNLKDNKKLAMSHFVFAKGIGNFNRSTLKKLIMAGKSIDNEIKKWCYYTTPKGRKVRSKYSLKIREWELKMYNMN